MLNSMRSILLLLVTIVSCIASGAQIPDSTDVDVRVQTGHVIESFTLSHNERYVFTSDNKSIAMWDLQKRKIVNILPVQAWDIYPHPVHPTYICVSQRGDAVSGDYYRVYDMVTLEEKIPIEKSRVAPSKTATQYLTFTLNDGVLEILILDTGLSIGCLDASPLPLSGSLDISEKDPGLIFVSGMEPVVWHTSEMTASTPIDYFGYLKDVASEGNIQLTNLHTPPIAKGEDVRRTFGWGWKQTTSGNFEPDGTIRICGYDGDISYWNTDGSLAKVLKASENTGPVFTIQKYDDKLVAATYNGIFCSDGNQPLKPWKQFNDKMGRYNVTYDVCPLFDGGKFLVACDNNFVLLGDLCDSLRYEKFTITPSSVMGVKIDDRHENALIYGELQLLREIGLNNDGYRVMYEGPLGGLRINTAEYLPDDHIAAGISDGRIAFWQRGLNRPMKIENVHGGAEVIDIKVAPDKSKFYSLDKRGTIVTWDVATLKPTMYLYSLGSGDYLYMTPEHYYSGSKRIFDKIHFTRGRDVFSFEQFDLLYNRPDIVLERLGGSAERVQLLRKAWERRARRMGVDPDDISTDSHIPTVKIVNAQTIPQFTTDTIITLNIKANDSKFNLSRLMININGVPFGSRSGEDIFAQNLSEYLTKKEIPLVTGRNHIEVSCMNEKGAESYKADLYISCLKPERKPTLYLAAIGVSEYQNAAYNLGYAAKDAVDFTKMISNHCSKSFGDIKMRCITDAEASADNLKGLRDFYAEAGVDDVAMLFYAGHGVLDSELEYYLSTYDMDFLNPADNGWHYDDFEDLLDGIRPLTKYCFIDACHSGKIDKDEFIEDNSRHMAAGALKFRGNGTSMTIPDKAKDINSAIQTLFTDFTKGNGATVLSSSGGLEVAIEDNKIANGLFTFAIRQGVEQRKADLNQDGIIQMSELADYVNRSVVKLSGGTQTPGMRVENKYIDLQILK